MKHFLVAMVVVLWTLSLGCLHAEGNDNALTGTAWRLTGWSASSSDPAQFTLTIAFEGSRVSGTSAVNSYGGACTATAGGDFAVGELISLGYFESAKAGKFRNAQIVLRRFVKSEGEDFVPVDILVGKTKEMDAIVDNAVPQPWAGGQVRVATKADLITLKRGRGSDQDKVDIRKLKK